MSMGNVSLKRNLCTMLVAPAHRCPPPAFRVALMSVGLQI